MTARKSARVAFLQCAQLSAACAAACATGDPSCLLFSLCTKHAISQTIAILLKDGYSCTLHLSVLTQYLNILKTRQYLKDQANVPGPRQPVPPPSGADFPKPEIPSESYQTSQTKFPKRKFPSESSQAKVPKLNTNVTTCTQYQYHD